MDHVIDEKTDIQEALTTVKKMIDEIIKTTKPKPLDTELTDKEVQIKLIEAMRELTKAIDKIPPYIYVPYQIPHYNPFTPIWITQPLTAIGTSQPSMAISTGAQTVADSGYIFTNEW